MTPEQKTSIDNMSYETMLTLWRFAPSGHPLMKLEVGKYYSDVMAQKKKKIGHDAAVAASKQVGWEV